ASLTRWPRNDKSRKTSDILAIATEVHTMQRSTDRILTTHVGSLVRPPALIDAMRRLDAGDPLPQPEYETLLRDSVRGVVQDQASNGVDVPSDGEFGKRGWTGYVVERLAGVEP